MMACPPALVTASAIGASAQATITGPNPASSARRKTWTIIGRPQISASGLSGSRVEAKRAGITTTGPVLLAARVAVGVLISGSAGMKILRGRQSRLDDPGEGRSLFPGRAEHSGARPREKRFSWSALLNARDGEAIVPQPF
jgi:hypothetical protein